MSALATADRRVLGAFRFVDAVSGQQVSDIPRVRSEVLDIRRNGSGIFVVFQAPGLRDLTTQFDPVKPWPDATASEITASASGRQYLPRRANVSMPRRPEPMSDPASSMIPQDVLLYPGPAAVLGLNWAIVRVSVRKKDSPGSEPGLPWAVVRMTRVSDGSELAVGVCDRRGEGVLAVPSARRTSSLAGGGAVVTATIDAALTAYFDPGNARQPEQWVPNPDDVLANVNDARLKRGQPAQPVKIGRGTSSEITIPIAV